MSFKCPHRTHPSRARRDPRVKWHLGCSPGWQKNVINRTLWPPYTTHLLAGLLGGYWSLFLCSTKRWTNSVLNIPFGGYGTLGEEGRSQALCQTISTWFIGQSRRVWRLNLRMEQSIHLAQRTLTWPMSSGSIDGDAMIVGLSLR